MTPVIARASVVFSSLSPIRHSVQTGIQYFSNLDSRFRGSVEKHAAAVSPRDSYDSLSAHFSRILSRSSRLERDTCGNVSFHSYGRVASMIARELKPFLSL
jgi:hypothetical protein